MKTTDKKKTITKKRVNRLDINEYDQNRPFQKLNRSKTSNDSGKPREVPGRTGLDGKYWNVSGDNFNCLVLGDGIEREIFIFQIDPANRNVNKPIFHRDHLDQAGESENVTNKKRSVSTSSSSSSTSSNERETLLYSNKTFITCRSPSDSFFLCQILQNVYNSTKRIPIRWCSLANGNDDDETKIDENTRFKLDYKDTLHPNTILIEIQNVIHHPDKTISLKKQDIIETNRLLKKSIKGESVDLTESKTTKRRRIKSGEAARQLFS